MCGGAGAALLGPSFVCLSLRPQEPCCSGDGGGGGWSEEGGGEVGDGGAARERQLMLKESEGDKMQGRCTLRGKNEHLEIMA